MTDQSGSNHLAWLQQWYLERCNGEWEHEYGIEITTLDNPGWKIAIDLADTDVSDLVVEHTAKHRSQNDWTAYEVREQKFTGACGPLCLNELVGVFRQYAEQAGD